MNPRERSPDLAIVRELLSHDGDKLSLYIPSTKIDRRPVERLIELGKKRDRSINYLVVEAILQYLEREEKQ